MISLFRKLNSKFHSSLHKTRSKFSEDSDALKTWNALEERKAILSSRIEEINLRFDEASKNGRHHEWRGLNSKKNMMVKEMERLSAVQLRIDQMLFGIEAVAVQKDTLKTLTSLCAKHDDALRTCDITTMEQTIKRLGEANSLQDKFSKFIMDLDGFDKESCSEDLNPVDVQNVIDQLTMLECGSQSTRVPSLRT